MSGGRGSGPGAILELLRDGHKTRAELVELSGQARATVAARLDGLMGIGLVEPLSGKLSTGGRPPTVFRFVKDAGVILAADLGAHHVRIAVTDLEARVLAERYETIDIADGPQVILSRVIDLTQGLLDEIKREPSCLVGAGIGVPGPVDHTLGQPISPPIMPGWDRCDIPGIIGRAFAVPTWVDNDVNLMAVGEHAYRWGHISNLLFVKVATGIGLGIILDGELRRGARGASGDLGHIMLPDAEGRLCRCGNIGCLEAEASGLAIASDLRAQGLEVYSSRDVVDLARGGNTTAAMAIREAGRKIGRTLASVVSLLNPSVIVIGGALALTGEQLLAGIRESVYARSLPMATQELRVNVSETEGRAGVIGAANMVMSEVLSPRAIDQLVEKGIPIR